MLERITNTSWHVTAPSGWVLCHVASFCLWLPIAWHAVDLWMVSKFRHVEGMRNSKLHTNERSFVRTGVKTPASHKTSTSAGPDRTLRHQHLVSLLLETARPLKRRPEQPSAPKLDWTIDFQATFGHTRLEFFAFNREAASLWDMPRLSDVGGTPRAWQTLSTSSNGSSVGEIAPWGWASSSSSGWTGNLSPTPRTNVARNCRNVCSGDLQHPTV